jgi:hypothetical protein
MLLTAGSVVAPRAACWAIDNMGPIHRRFFHSVSVFFVAVSALVVSALVVFQIGTYCCSSPLVQVTKEAVEKSKPIWDKVYASFKRAEEAASGSKAEKTEQREAARADLVSSPPATDETHLMANQVKIIWGNALYDQSQIWAGVGLDGWKDMVEDARTRFISATCKESDVVEAMRNHICAEQLDLPILDKVPAKVPAKAAAQANAPTPAKVAEPAKTAADGKAASKDAPRGGLPALKGKKAKSGGK